MTKRRTAISCSRSLALLFVIIASPAVSAADYPSTDPLIRKLVQPMRAIVDGKAFRAAIQSVASQATINVWLDRRVNPSITVAPGPIGPTAWSALSSIAATQDCAVFPVANIVLIGRPMWVDRTALSVLLLEIDPAVRDNDNRSISIGDIRWADLTSPSEALMAAAGHAVTVDPPLPHDLWPAVDWRSIDRRVAITLVLAQFDRRPESTTSIARIRTAPANLLGQVESNYRLGKLTTVFRSAFTSADRSGRVRVRNGTATAIGPIAAHRSALATALTSAEVGDQSNRQSVYTIKRMRTSAKHALEQLAKLADVECRIEADAREACQQIVSIEGRDLTIRQLIDLVVAEAGVKAVWNGDTIVISGPSPTTD